MLRVTIASCRRCNKESITIMLDNPNSRSLYCSNCGSKDVIYSTRKIHMVEDWNSIKRDVNLELKPLKKYN